MAYYSDEQTDRELARLERSITKEYTVAYKELQRKTAEYFEDFAVRDAQMREALEDGTYPLPAGYSAEAYYKLWRQNQLGRGARWEKLRDNMAKRITEANKVAAAYINDTTPGIYSLNYNYEAYQIEGITGAAFDIYNEQTVKQLVQGENHTEFRTVSINPVRDYAWNTKKINTALLSGIMQGKSIKGLADGFMTVMKNNRTAAVRNARTAVTSAQNSGRVETYRKAAAMGIEIKKRWLATEDERTRDSHRELDGVTVELDEVFPNGLQYPGDPKGAPAEVYNCRCTMLSILPKYNADLHNTGNTVESYKKWLKNKKANNQVASPIESRTGNRGKPQAINVLGIELNNRQKKILQSLKQCGDEFITNKSNVSMKDLSALTAHTGDEFAMFTKKAERLIIRGDNKSCPVDIKKAMELKSNGYKWSGHTHPTSDAISLMPSKGDIDILKAFNQKQSVIYDAMGRFSKYRS